MTPDQILALTPGEQLDGAIHEFVFGNAGPREPYSTNDAAGAKILDRMSLCVGRVDSGPRYSVTRPWIAGALAWDPRAEGYVIRLSVTAPTRLIALGKVALLVIFQATKPAKAPVVTSAQQAKDVAARIGTPGARSPAAGILAAERAAAKKAADRAAKQEKEARKAARRTGKPYVAPNGGGEAPETVVHRQPRLAAPAVRPQPSVFTGERAPRAPMPTRPKEIVLPQPIDTGGNQRGGAT